MDVSWADCWPLPKGRQRHVYLSTSRTLLEVGRHAKVSRIGGVEVRPITVSRDTLLDELYDWQTPSEMEARVDQLAKLLGDDAMQRVGKPFREAWVANRFARRTGREAVRLLRENSVGTTPDFAVRSHLGEQLFETTEADIPGRRRQAEYRDPTQQGVQPMVFTSLAVMVGHIKGLVAKKAAKTYQGCTGLVVHMNPPAFSFDPRFRTQQFLEATQPGALAFGEIWLLRDMGVLLWKKGVPANEVPDDF